MHYLAQHDVLSGALNRASFNDELERAAWRAEAGGAGFAVLCVDLDRFKEVNDSLGHAAGDEVLRQVSQRLRALLRHGDQVARLGGDEFAILQTGVAGPADVATLAQRVVEIAGRTVRVRGPPDHHAAAASGRRSTAPTASRPTNCCTRPTWRCIAPRAKAAAASASTRRDSTGSCRSGASWRTTSARPSSRGDLSLHYQPLYAADGVTLVGYEALARWQHPDARQRAAGRLHSGGRRRPA